MTFRERYMAGEADFDEIFDLTDEWMASDLTCTLAVYLGLNADEEDIWISDSDEALEAYMEKEKTRRALFTDLDQTLLNSAKMITPSTRTALKQMLDGGHYVVLTTGRVLPAAQRVASTQKLNRKGCYIICCNGAQIYDTTGHKMLFRQALDTDLIREACTLANAFGIHIQGYSDTDVVSVSDNDCLQRYCEIQHLPSQVVADLANSLADGSPKLLAIDPDPKRAAQFRALAQEKLSGRADVFMSSATYVEIVPIGINKGAALENLCRYLGIPVSQSVAAGDEENDITMIRAAGTGCAMANATDAVKAAADYITKADCEHDGVAEIIQQFIL